MTTPTAEPLTAEQATRLENENTILRGIASKIMPCRFCGVDEIGKCPHGFPGCSLADDIFVCEELTSKTIVELRKDITALQAQLAEATGWRGIESCPKDRPFLAKKFPTEELNYTSCAREVWWDKEEAEMVWKACENLGKPRKLTGRMFKCWDASANPPTHWTEVPAPPQAGKE